MRGRRRRRTPSRPALGHDGLMSRSTALRAANAPTWDAAIHHRFVDELLDGTVDDDVLRRYLVQDYLFCDAFTALLGQACASAPDLAARLPYARQLGFFASTENTYFTDAFDALGVPDKEWRAPTPQPATAAFDEVMRDAVASRSYGQAVAVLLVAEWLYLDWADRAAAEGREPTRPEHLGWVDVHRGADFTRWVQWLRDELDAIELDPVQEADVAAVFARAVRCELAFFDAAYTD